MPHHLSSTTRHAGRGALAAVVAAALIEAAAAGHPGAPVQSPAAHDAALEDAQRLFYNGRYEPAAALAQELCAAEVERDLDACELRTAALHFQIRRALGETTDKQKALKGCAACPSLIAAFQATLSRGQALARARLEAAPGDDEALFLLGKLDLNHVWLHLGTLGRRTGWGEYWEGRRSLDKLLKRNPGHVRARVARAWVDYIVDTKLPRGTRWLLGGGNRKRGLRVVGEAALAEADFFTRIEARFAHWEMQVRERNMAEALTIARVLVRDFPENQDLRKFLATQEGAPDGDRIP